MKPEISIMLEHAPLIVGVVGSMDDALKVQDSHTSIDVVELRLDCLVEPDRAVEIVQRSGKPIIITARDASEGGNASDWTIDDRAALYLKYMPIASFVDIEVFKMMSLGSVMDEAKARDIGIIASFHHWGSPMPTPESFHHVGIAATAAGADILKLAIQVHSYEDLLYLAVTVLDLPQQILQSSRGLRTSIPTATMAMGIDWGKFSRILFGKSGTTLVYGHLGNPKVMDQGHVSEIRSLLAQFSG